MGFLAQVDIFPRSWRNPDTSQKVREETLAVQFVGLDFFFHAFKQVFCFLRSQPIRMVLSAM